jgi:hypothetical protein
MSFDIFFDCINNDGGKTFKRQLAQEILGRDAIKPADALLSSVAYPDGSGSEVYCSKDEDLDGMMFNHSGGDTFFERLWELADRTGSMIFWPGDGVPVAVTRPELLQHLPKSEAGDEMEPQFVVRNGKELQEAIYGAS